MRLLKIGLILIMVVGGVSSPVRDATSSDAYILCLSLRRFIPLGGFATLHRALGAKRHRRLQKRISMYTKKLIVISTTNLQLTLKSNTMKNSIQNYKIFLKQCYKTYKYFYNLT